MHLTSQKARCSAKLKALSLDNPIPRLFICQEEKKTLPRTLAGVSELVCVATHLSQRQEFQPDSLSFRAIEHLIEV